MTPPCQHEFTVGFEGVANGRYEQHLVCERCGYVSIGWQPL